jgi:hypothetical protein
LCLQNHALLRTVNPAVVLTKSESMFAAHTCHFHTYCPCHIQTGVRCCQPTRQTESWIALTWILLRVRDSCLIAVWNQA